MEERTIKTLEFSKILDEVAHFASGRFAKNKILSIRPYSCMKEIEDELTRVSEADKILFEYSITPSFAVDDVEDLLQQASVMSMLTPADLLKVARVLKVARTLKQQLTNVNDDTIIEIKDLANTIYTNVRLENDIDKAVLSETELSDDASSDLRVIRSKVRKTGEGIKNKLNSYVNSVTYQKYLQDALVTVRGDRYVLPVKAEFKSAIPGLIHDRSASGSTLYVEPLAVVEMNNDLKQLILEEKIEIERILRVFTARIASEAGFLKYTFETITELDVLFAKAYYADAYSCVKPVFNETGYVNIVKGRHPLIPAEKVVANDVYIGKDFNVLLITGPNTGGKTVCLKMLGLIELMGLSGLYVPCQEAELTVFDDIFCDIGDEQSIEQSLSTFSSHMTNVVRIINEATDKSLILLDELGAGTDPTEGAALALSITEYIMQLGAKAVITTHYNEFKEFALVTDGAQNASMDFNPMTYSPTYKLIIGLPGASNALIIAEKLGLKKEIIEKARNGINQQKFDFENVMLSLEQKQREAEIYLEESVKAKKEADEIKRLAEEERKKLYEQRDRLNVSVKKETKRLVEEAMVEVNEIIAKIKDFLDNPTEKNLFEARRLRKSLNKYIIIDNNEFEGILEEEDGKIAVGDRVLVKAMNAEGVVSDINPAGNIATVRLGNMTTKAKITDLTRLKPIENQKKKQNYRQDLVNLHNESVPTEFNIIGKTGIEAEELLEEYLDRAVRGGLHEIRIIHGYGEGILRKVTQKYLKSRKEIESFRDGNYGEGGKGVTVAYIK